MLTEVIPQSRSINNINMSIVFPSCIFDGIKLWFVLGALDWRIETSIDLFVGGGWSLLNSRELQGAEPANNWTLTVEGKTPLLRPHTF